MMFTLLLAMAELVSADVQGARRTEQTVRPRSSEVAWPSPPVDSLGTMGQLTNPRTGVTCTMRVLKAEPVDKAAVTPAPEPSVDPEIRGRISPCLD